jgi:hypothetical protein
MKQFNKGDRIKVLREFANVPIGSLGTVIELYEPYELEWKGKMQSILIAWDAIGTDFGNDFKSLTDGFSPDEFKYLEKI